MNISVFMKNYYGVLINKEWSLSEFCDWKDEHNINEWDYPLDELDHVLENGITYKEVKFDGNESRLCEVPIM